MSEQVTQVTLSQQALDLMLVEHAIRGHQDAICAKLLEMESIIHLPFAPEVRRVIFDKAKREVMDLNVQLQAMLILRDDIANCLCYPNGRLS